MPEIKKGSLKMQKKHEDKEVELEGEEDAKDTTETDIASDLDSGSEIEVNDEADEDEEFSLDE